MENNIKQCFTLFVKYLKIHGGLKDLPEYDINKMTMDELIGHIDVLYMQYLTSGYGLSSNSPVPLAYDHLMKMIDKKIN